MVSQSLCSDGKRKSCTRAVAMITAPHPTQMSTGSDKVRDFLTQTDRGDEEQRGADEAHGEHGRIGDERTAGVLRVVDRRGETASPSSASSRPRAR